MDTMGEGGPSAKRDLRPRPCPSSIPTEDYRMRRTRPILVFVLAAIMLAVPSVALANKRIYSADLLNAAGAHKGSALVGTNQNGTMRFQVVARSLSSPVTAAHIHSAEDGSILITLCGSGPGRGE